MDQYYASLARACASMGEFTQLYMENIPDSFAVPSLYFPPPETDPSGSAFNSYRTDYTVYAKVFAATRQEAGELADGIAQGIMLKKCRLPIYNEDGTENGGIMKLEPPVTRVIDEGVAQITLIYHVFRSFPKEELPMAKDIRINKNYD